jgi:GNAT superfamily N-acetyltransferase
VTQAIPSFYDVIDETWPAARFEQCGPWTLRQGQGGGSRVSAATANGQVDADDIDTAVSAMRAMGQKPLFMIREGDAAIDQMLAERGYEIVDPVVIYACPVAQLTDQEIPRVMVFALWEPLAIMREIWASGGVGSARLAIMDRAKNPKTGLLARYRDKPAGVAYVAVHKHVAMVHAVEILPHQRRAGVGKWMMRGAAFWAAQQGATLLTVMCTRQNTAANALYTSLGMQVVGHYHYRHLPKEPDLT